MYQSIRILQLVCPIYRAPHSHLHDKKGHLRLVTKVPKRVLPLFSPSHKGSTSMLTQTQGCYLSSYLVTWVIPLFSPSHQSTTSFLTQSSVTRPLFLPSHLASASLLTMSPVTRGYLTQLPTQYNLQQIIIRGRVIGLLCTPFIIDFPPKTMLVSQ